MLFPWYIKYPNQNDEILNLDWILSTIDNLVNEVANFVSLNTIKYANPIQWNITTQYEKNTVVIDPITGSAYISTKPVPSGVGLNNTDYWNIIFTLDVISANKNITLRDDANNILATFESAIGDWLLWQGTLYVVTKAIDIGQSYVEGYNIDRYTVEKFIKHYITQTVEYTDELINNLNDIIGDLDNLTTTDKSNTVAAINELVTSLSDLSDNISSITGDLDNLTTTDKSNLVAAINELVTSLSDLSDNISSVTGDLDDLITTDKSSLVNAINENTTRLNNSTHHSLQGSILVIGDSYVDVVNSCAHQLCGFLGKTLNTNFFISALGGSGFSAANSGKNYYDLLTDSLTMITDHTSVSAVLFIGGYNDAGRSTLLNDVINTINYAKTNYVNADIFVFDASAGSQQIQAKLQVDEIYAKGCSSAGASYNYIGYILKLYEDVMNSNDLTHPTADGQNLLAGALLTVLKGGIISSNNNYALIRSTNPLWDSKVWILSDNVATKIVMDRTKGVLSFTSENGGQLDGDVRVAHIPIYIQGKPTILKGDNLAFIKAYGTCQFSIGSGSYKAGGIDVVFTEGYMNLYLSSLSMGWDSISAGDTINLASIYFECVTPTKWI